MLTVHFVRHGEVANPQQIVYGRRPRFGLSESGRLQADAAARRLSTLPIAAVFSSPLLRARQTAQIIAAPHHLALRFSRLLTEVLSPYEGRPLAEFLQLDNIYADLPEGYERPEDLTRRMQGFTRRAAREFPGQEVVVVTHGDLILSMRTWAQDVLGASGDRAAPLPYPAYASITSIRFDGDEVPSGVQYWRSEQPAP